MSPCARVSRRCFLADSLALRPAVFLDRDGTIAEEVGYLNHLGRFRMFPLVPEAFVNDLRQAVNWIRKDKP